MLLSKALPVTAVMLVAAFLSPVAVATDADLIRGERIFQMQCAGCHAVTPGDHRAGPSLYRVLGRPAGDAEGFEYSPAMGEADLIWTPERLDAFLENPEQVVPGNRMVFWGLDEREREQVIRYLEQVGGE